MSNDSPIEGVGFNDFIEAKKRLAHEPAALREVVNSLGLGSPERWGAVERAWQARVDEDPMLREVYEMFVGQMGGANDAAGAGSRASSGGSEAAAALSTSPMGVVPELPSYMLGAAPPRAPAALMEPPAAVRIRPGADPPIEPSVESTLAPIPRAAAASPLPFRDGNSVTAPTVGFQLPRDRSEDPDASETIGIGGTVAPTAATPFEESALERWTVEAYASFVTDRRIDPADLVRATYGLKNTAEEAALLVHMNKRFGREPAELARWRKLVEERMTARAGGSASTVRDVERPFSRAPSHTHAGESPGAAPGAHALPAPVAPEAQTASARAARGGAAHDGSLPPQRLNPALGSTVGLSEADEALLNKMRSTPFVASESAAPDRAHRRPELLGTVAVDPGIAAHQAVDGLPPFARAPREPAPAGPAEGAVQAPVLPALGRFVEIQRRLGATTDRALALAEWGYTIESWQAVLKSYGALMQRDPELRSRYERLLLQGDPSVR